MFIDLNELKGIIIDLDSFPLASDPTWSNVDTTVDLLFFSSEDRTRLDGIKALDKRFKIYSGSPISVFAKKDIVIDMLAIMNIESCEAAFLSSKYENIKIIQQLPLATIEYSDDYTKYEKVGQLADFQISSLDDLNSIIRKETLGYFSEVSSIIYNKGAKLDFKVGDVIITEKEYSRYKSTVVSGGRYFNTNDVRFPYHQLSKRILRNKRRDTNEYEVFGNIYGSLVRFINDNIAEVDGITRVPPRPINDDRFIEIVNRICIKNSQYTNYCDDLMCIKNYPSQKGLNEAQRQANILGAFEASGNMRGKHVILIDDVISTGSTAFEAAKTMYDNGVGRITILVLAINQFTNYIRSHYYTPLSCECGREIKMMFNRQSSAAFFGCVGFFDRKCKNNLDYFDGLIKHNIENRITTDTDQFDIDEWEF